MSQEAQPRAAGSGWWKPAVWLVYFAIVFEILFMISPFALYYYSAYAPFLNFLGDSPLTAWLDRFFLPHFSTTSSPVLNRLPDVGRSLFFAGLTVFVLGFLQVYGAKFFRKANPVTGGLYRWIRHPQYIALAVMGLGVVLVWPRFLVLMGYVTMLFLYYFLARHEERRCLARYGEGYQAYLNRTGMFFPRSWFAWMPQWLPTSGWPRAVALVTLYVIVMGMTALVGLQLQYFSLTQVASLATADMAVLSPAQLPRARLAEALEVSLADPKVARLLETHGYGIGEKFLAYAVPVEWKLPDLPMEVQPEGGHYTPADFNPDRLKLFFTHAQLYDSRAKGLEIARVAVRREPVLLIKLDLAKRAVVAHEEPPATVRWGDVPTPYF